LREIKKEGTGKKGNVESERERKKKRKGKGKTKG
jgi:hypothetical protein